MELWLLIFPLFIVLSVSVYRFRRRIVTFRQEEANYSRLLEQHCAFYKPLNAKQKRLFEQRVRRFIGRVSFIPRNFGPVTLEMKALIAASATQLTFGLTENRLRYFTKIIIYPDVYFSVINRRYHKGEVNPAARAIVLSWKDFKAGLHQSGSSINLGLHEMAHALWLANKYADQEILEDKWIKKWIAQAWLEMQHMRQGQSSIFRTYGARNENEFFAVAVEHFFTKPEEFKQKAPRLYDILSHLLRQDPLSMEKGGKDR